MKFRDYYDLPDHLLNVPDDTLERIERVAGENEGVVLFYFHTPRCFFTKQGQRWMTVYQLLEFDINTNQLTKLYPYRKVVVKGETPAPLAKHLLGRPFFGHDTLPPGALKMLRDKAYYYKVRAKKQ